MTGTVGVLVAAVLAGVWLLREVGRRVVVGVPLAAVVVAGMLDYLVKISVVRPRPDAALRADRRQRLLVSLRARSDHRCAGRERRGRRLSRGGAANAPMARSRSPRDRCHRLGVEARPRCALDHRRARRRRRRAVVVALVVVVALMPLPRTERPPRRRRVPLTVPQRLAVLPLIAVFAAIGSSYVSALRAPGYATVDVRTVDWLKGHGFTSVVDRAEAWWLWKHPPSTKDTLRVASRHLPSPPSAGSRALQHRRALHEPPHRRALHHRTARRPRVSPRPRGRPPSRPSSVPLSLARANGPLSRLRPTGGSRSRRRGCGLTPRIRI